MKEMSAYILALSKDRALYQDLIIKRHIDSWQLVAVEINEVWLSACSGPIDLAELNELESRYYLTPLTEAEHFALRL